MYLGLRDYCRRTRGGKIVGDRKQGNDSYDTHEVSPTLLPKHDLNNDKHANMEEGSPRNLISKQRTTNKQEMWRVMKLVFSRKKK